MMNVIAVPLRIFYYVLRPLIGLANSSSNVLIKWFVPDAEKTESFYRRQDVELIFKELKEGGEVATLMKMTPKFCRTCSSYLTCA